MKVTSLAAATAGLVLVAAPALAVSPPYAVTVGSSTTGTYTVLAQGVPPLTFLAKNSSGMVIDMSCGPAVFRGNVTAGTSKNPYGTITQITWDHCKLPGGSATASIRGTWHLTGTGRATTGDDVVAGYVSDLSAYVAVDSNPNLCSFAVVGSASDSFDERNQVLSINETGFTGHAKLTEVRGCLGKLQTGNPVDLRTPLGFGTSGGAMRLS